MDEEVNPEEENVNSVLAQESSELFHILTSQSPTVMLKLCQTITSGSGWDSKHLATSEAAGPEYIKAMLEYFKLAEAAHCCFFLEKVCLLCENIPMRLESRLLSVAGYANKAIQSPVTEPVTTRNTEASASPTAANQKSPLPPPEEQLIKRPRIDHWERYIAAVRSLLQKRWERLSEHLVSDVLLDNVWISLRTTNPCRDRPDQTPGSADRGRRTPEPNGDYLSIDSRVTLEIFLQGCTGKVTVLLGPAGSGKTLLMSCLGQQWARGLGPIPSSFLFVLLEFRQLNLLSKPLSLCELLLRYYLPPTDEDQGAIVEYILSNPEQSCWVLDGYDEFQSKVTRQEVQKELLDPEEPLPVVDLISGLLNRHFLPSCTVVVTCRERDVIDLEGITDKVGHLLGWNRREIKEYVHNFFGARGDMPNRALGVQAADLLLSTPHLFAMSSLPALCNICCICLEHLLQDERDTEDRHTPEERRSVMGKNVRDTEVKGEQNPGDGGDQVGRIKRRQRERDDIMMDVTNARIQPSPTNAQIPSTLTQVYLTVLGAFLSRDPNTKGGKEKSTTLQPLQSVVFMLSQYGSELCGLIQLAWQGLEVSKIVFTEKDIPQDVLDFSIRTGLFSQVELRHEDGKFVKSYCFIHLTVHEFLAALRIMTSQDVSDMQLKKRLSLKTRWTTKSDQRTVFTYSLHLFVCGLASPNCTPALVQLSRACGGTGGQCWVRKRQALVLKLLKNLCNSNTLTGPKILELCKCVQESQDHELAKQVVGTRPTLELRNIRLSPNDIDALAFVVNSVSDTGVGLDFGACSMDMECLDVLSTCQYIHFLCFRSRRYGDTFAEKLSSILPKFTSLRKLEFCSASLTATGSSSLVSALQNCPDITEINLNDNDLKDEGIEHIADVFDKLPKLVLITLGQNNTSLKALDCLIRKMSSCLNIQYIHANGMKEVTVTFSKNSDPSSYKTMPEPTISLLNQKWSKSEMQIVAESLASCPVLSVLDLSGGQWDTKTLKTFTRFLPKFNVTQKIVVNDSCSSVEGLVILTALISDCPAMRELHIRLQSPVQVSVVSSGGGEKPANATYKTLCLSCCGLLPADLDRLLRSLGSSSDVTLLDLSSNSLGNKGLNKLLQALPRFSSIREINVSNNGINMEGLRMLAGALGSHHKLSQIYISGGSREQVTLKFFHNKSDDKQLKTFSINNSSLLPSDINTLCRELAKCSSTLELDLSHSLLPEDTIENLLKVVPKMESLQRLNVSHSITSTTGALMLLSCLTVSHRATSAMLRLHGESFISFDNVKAEQASCRLTQFSLSGENLERLLGILQRGPRLSDLDLSSNQLRDEGVKRILNSLFVLKITNYVNLSNNSLTQQGVLDVASTLCDVSAVEVSLGAEERCLIWFTQDEGCGKTLSVRDSSLEQSHLIRLADIVSVCPNLTKLEIKNNLLQLDWIEDFVKRLDSSQKILSVRIEEHWIRSKEAVSLVCRCLNLCNNIHTVRVHQTTLQLFLMKASELTSVSDKSADLTRSIATEKISLVDCAVEGYQLSSMMSTIQRCPFLKELVLSHNSLGVEGAEFLCSVLPTLPNLSSLSVGSKEACVSVIEKLSKALLQATAIQHLKLSGHVISDTAVQIMTKVVPHLRLLNLSHCVWSPAGGMQLVKTLGDCVHLEGLCLDSMLLNEGGILCLAQALQNFTAMRSLKLNKIATEMGPSGSDGALYLLDAIEGLAQMKEIELEGWRMADAGIEKIAKHLSVWTELRKISLSKNLISDQSGDKLLEALTCCSHLEVLNLSRNSLGDFTAARMALVLPSLTHISVLDISENQIGHEGSVSMSKAIMGMQSLKKIHLTSVGTSELCAVAASLAHCPLIKDVGLGWNNCRDDVALELAKVLPLCQKLTSIDLESNSVSALGAEALAGALQSCPALQLIRLWRNKVSPIDAQRFILRDRRLNFSST